MSPATGHDALIELEALVSGRVRLGSPGGPMTLARLVAPFALVLVAGSRLRFGITRELVDHLHGIDRSNDDRCRDDRGIDDNDGG
jgi:hypothetical protein